jgi:hypothetical protein
VWLSNPVLPTIFLLSLSFLPSKMLRGSEYSDEIYVFTSSFFTTIMVLIPIAVMVLRTMIHDELREVSATIKRSPYVQIMRYTVVPMDGDEESGCCAAIDY